MKSKNLIKNVLLIGGVTVLTVGMLTGCGKKNDETKTYDKENIAINTNQTEENKVDVNKLIKDEIESQNFLSENGIKGAYIGEFSYRIVESNDGPIYIVCVGYQFEGEAGHGKIFQVYYANEKVNFEVIEDHKYMSEIIEYDSSKKVLRMSVEYKGTTRKTFLKLNNGKFEQFDLKYDNAEDKEYNFEELKSTKIEVKKENSKTNSTTSNNDNKNHKKSEELVVTREGFVDTLPSKEYVSSLGYTMRYASEIFNASYHDNCDWFEREGDINCVTVEKENVSYSKKVASLSNYKKTDVNGYEAVYTTRKVEGQFETTYYVNTGKDVTYEITTSFQDSSEYFEGLGQIMNAMVQTFLVK